MRSTSIAAGQTSLDEGEEMYISNTCTLMTYAVGMIEFGLDEAREGGGGGESMSKP